MGRRGKNKIEVVIDEAGNVITAFPKKQEVSFVNFYIGNSIENIDEQDENIEFSDELLDFIYKSSKQVSIDISKLHKIDPYDDVEISENDIAEIVEICNYILETSLLENYKEPDEGKQMLQDLVKIAQKAKSNGLGLVSIGD